MNTPLQKLSGIYAVVLVLLALYPVHSQVTDSTNALTTAQLLDLSGGKRVKLVWARMLVPGNPGTNMGATNMGPNHDLVVFDTDEKKQRTLQATSGTYDRPIITRDGSRVIWNDQTNAESWICNWDGSGKTRLLKGDNATIAAHVAATRYDSVEKKDYIYVGVTQYNWGPTNPKFYSYPLNGLTLDTAHKKVIWDSATAGSDICDATWFSVSADGKYAAGEFNGGINCLGLVELATQKIVETRAPAAGAVGCMPNSAPDNSRMWFHAMQGHSWMYLYRYGQGGNRIYMRPDSLYPNMGTWSYTGAELQHWSNHPRYLTIGASMAFGNEISQPYNEPAAYHWQFYVGRFDAAYTKIEKWVQVSHARQYYSEYSGNAWFDLGNTSASNVRPDHSTSAIGKAARNMQAGTAFDIQGRKIGTSGTRMQKTAAGLSTGVYIENGQLRLLAR